MEQTTQEAPIDPTKDAKKLLKLVDQLLTAGPAPPAAEDIVRELRRPGRRRQRLSRWLRACAVVLGGVFLLANALTVGAWWSDRLREPGPTPTPIPTSTKEPPPSAPTAPACRPTTTAKTEVHLFAGPWEGAEPLHAIPAGEEVEVIGRNPGDEWLAVHLAPDRNGWVRTEKVETEDLKIEDLPEIVAEPPPPPLSVFPLDGAPTLYRRPGGAEAEPCPALHGKPLVIIGRDEGSEWLVAFCVPGKRLVWFKRKDAGIPPEQMKRLSVLEPPAGAEQVPDEPDGPDEPTQIVGVVTSDGDVELYQGSETEYEVVGAIPPGTSLTILGQAKGQDGRDWFRVQYADDKEPAWVLAELVELQDVAIEDIPREEELEPPLLIVRGKIGAEGATYRSGPGVSYTKVGEAAGVEIEILGRAEAQVGTGEWFQICCTVDGEQAWVQASLVELELPTGVTLDDIPLVSGFPEAPTVWKATVAGEKNVNYRSGPGTEYAPPIAYWKPGTQVEVLGQAMSSDQVVWFRVCCAEDGRAAWVSSGLVTLQGETTIDQIPPVDDSEIP